jgi:multidrug efflux pump subunit AcrA (membrane-fusion protein)
MTIDINHMTTYLGRKQRGRASRAGRVKRVAASPGIMVQAGAVLVELEDAEG